MNYEPISGLRDLNMLHYALKYHQAKEEKQKADEEKQKADEENKKLVVEIKQLKAQLAKANTQSPNNISKSVAEIDKFSQLDSSNAEPNMILSLR